MRRGSLGATAKAMRPSPCALSGRPALSLFHVLPPSVDLYRPLVLPVKLPFSHGPSRWLHIAANTTVGFVESISTCAAPVLRSTNSTFCQVPPPSVVRHTPRSSFGPYGWPLHAQTARLGYA